MAKATRLSSCKVKKKAQKVARKSLDKLERRGFRRRAGVVVVCEKCGKQKQASRLARWLEKSLAARGLAQRVEIERSGCLGPCPRRRVSVAFGTRQERDWKRCYLVHPEDDREQFMRVLEEKLAV